MALQHNRLSSVVPECIGSMRKLYRLELNGNHFDGDIPQSFEHLVFLQTLEMDDAQLENIPKLIKARGGPYVIKFLQGDVPEFLLKEMEEAAHAEANPESPAEQ